MMKTVFKFISGWSKGALKVIPLIALTTAAIVFIGKNTLGEGLISLIYLVPIGWSTVRWGQEAGVTAAITSALAFDYFFIPPYNTFNVGSIEGWLILIIFLIVSVVVIRQIQSFITQTELREREAVIMYELVSALSNLQSIEAIARTLAILIQQRFQAALVKVYFYGKGDGASVSFSAPANSMLTGSPDRTIPIITEQKLTGEISIWRGPLPLPSEDNWLMQSFIRQTARALERVGK